jgi:hypothetical protein
VRVGLAAVLVACAASLLAPRPAGAFPPYRSTDAETAGAGVVQLRLGLLRIQREDGRSRRSAPLARANFGLGEQFEIVSELEYAPDDRELAEGALGFKWARRRGRGGIGVETLALLPVQTGHSGAGIESQFIATLARERWQLHFNGGVFYDPRATITERGWRTSLLVESRRGRWRPGAELFAKRPRAGATRMQAGVGMIADLPRVQVRAGLHAGLSDAAPDLEASVWLAWSWPAAR